jgi:hypothetical protein
LNLPIKPAELDSRVGGLKLPVNLFAAVVPVRVPDRYPLPQARLVADPLASIAIPNAQLLFTRNAGLSGKSGAWTFKPIESLALQAWRCHRRFQKAAYCPARNQMCVLFLPIFTPSSAKTEAVNVLVLPLPR